MEKISLFNTTSPQVFRETTPSFLKRMAELSTKTPSFLAKVAIVSYQLQTVFAQKPTDQPNDFTRNVGYATFGSVIILLVGALLNLLSLCFCKKASLESSNDSSPRNKTSRAKEVSYLLMMAGLFGTAVFGLMYIISSTYPDINTRNH